MIQSNIRINTAIMRIHKFAMRIIYKIIRSNKYVMRALN